MIDKKGWSSSAGGGAQGMPGANSERMKKIEALRPMIHKIPDVREHLVRTLREEIRGGRYRVDPRKVAERIMEELL
jgi:flagellar biosynthesis anti-sigma factor FlgM